MPVKIHGKEYVTVDERINEFRQKYPDGQITSEIIEHNLETGFILIRSDIYIDGKLIANGHAYEIKSASNINKTSYIEVCETSAIGRALGVAGFSVLGGVATAEEIKQATEQQQIIKEQEDKECEHFCEKYLAELEEVVELQDVDAYKEIQREYRANKYAGRIRTYINKHCSENLKGFNTKVLDIAKAKTENRLTTPPE